MLHQREIASSPGAAFRADQHEALRGGSRAKPPWLPRLSNGRFERALAQMDADERMHFFVLLIQEIARLRQLHELGLLTPIMAERAANQSE